MNLEEWHRTTIFPTYSIWKSLVKERIIIFEKNRWSDYCLNHPNMEISRLFLENPGRGGGELPYEEYMGVCHELGSYFQEKIPKRGCHFFTKIPERAIISVGNSR